MEVVPEKKWYQKRKAIIPAVLLGIFLFSAAYDNTASPTPANSTSQNSASAVLSTQQNLTEKNKSGSVQDVPLSNNNYYTNSIGNSVHSPAYANQVPEGATAECRDGTYSFSQSRRGTCSHHGGVADWL